MIRKATHVLTWFPEGHLDSAAVWQLRENREEGMEEEADVTLVGDLSGWPADTGSATLAGWVREVLGAPVHLGVRQEKRIKTGVFARTVVPFHYVFPED